MRAEGRKMENSSSVSKEVEKRLRELEAEIVRQKGIIAQLEQDGARMDGAKTVLRVIEQQRQALQRYARS